MTCFYLVFTSEQQARKYLNAFTELQDAFAAALLRSYPRPVLTDRKKIILQERAYGKMPHEIAKELSIRPVRSKCTSRRLRENCMPSISSMQFGLVDKRDLSAKSHLRKEPTVMQEIQPIYFAT
jgi:hypothetical protein